MSCNGIDTEQLVAFGELLHTTPEAGALSVEVRTDWTYGYTVGADMAGVAVGGEAFPREHTLAVDLPQALGGQDRGAAPGELLLSALGACVTQAFVEEAAVHGVIVRGLRVAAEAELDLRGAVGIAGVRPGISHIRLGFEVDCATSGEVVEELVTAAVRTSPIADTLTPGVAIDVSVRQPSRSG